MYCQISDLDSEADVEQKFIIRMLTALPPNGLGFRDRDILTQPYISTFKIGKGASQKDYRPDYVLSLSGVPTCVVEAKAPDKDVHAGFAEARLYANELNAQRPTHINPCHWVIASNGLLTLAGTSDVADPLFTLPFDAVTAVSAIFATFITELGSENQRRLALRLRYQPHSGRLSSANKLAGPDAAEAASGGILGQHLNQNYSHILLPQTQADKERIARDAYVETQERTRHATDVAQLMHRILSVSPDYAEQLRGGESLIRAMRTGRDRLLDEFILLIGSRGCGKSLFITRLMAVTLPSDVSEATIWVRLDMNPAPESTDSLETWLIENITLGLKASHPDVDFGDPLIQEKIFGQQVAEKRRSAAHYFGAGSKEEKQQVAAAVAELRNNPLEWMRSIARYLCDEKGRVLVIVYDNCDKRDRETQVKVFQAARWLAQQLHCLFIISLRDTTFKEYRNDLPFDVSEIRWKFHITPPPFNDVVKLRMKLILEEVSKDAEGGEYIGPLGARVPYTAAQVTDYINGLYIALFEHEAIISGLLFGLAGADIRKAISLFIEICKSGHLTGTDIFTAKVMAGGHRLSKDTIVKILMCGKGELYVEQDEGIIQNLYQCSKPELGDYTTRRAIVWWLHLRYADGTVGDFAPLLDLCRDLNSAGHDTDVIVEQCDHLIKANVVECSHQKPAIEGDEDLIRLTPSGIVHYELTDDLAYIGGCAEDVLVEKNLAETILTVARDADLAPDEKVLLKTFLLKTFVAEKERKFFIGAESTQVGAVRCPPAELAIKQRLAKYSHQLSGILWSTVWKNSAGREIEGAIEKKLQTGAYLVRLDDGPVGYLPQTDAKKAGGFVDGSRLIVRIVDVYPEEGRARLEYIGPAKAS